MSDEMDIDSLLHTAMAGKPELAPGTDLARAALARVGEQEVRRERLQNMLRWIRASSLAAAMLIVLIVAWAVNQAPAQSGGNSNDASVTVLDTSVSTDNGSTQWPALPAPQLLLVTVAVLGIWIRLMVAPGAGQPLRLDMRG